MNPVPVQVPDSPHRRLFSVDDYHAMARAGILSRDEKVELLDGEIVTMTPIGSRHAACVDGLVAQLFAHRPDNVTIRVQGPVRLDDLSEPEPDIAVIRSSPDYAERHPGPEDVLLLIEVADTFADRDRHKKLRLYARAGISELWIVDLNERQVEVCRDPEGDRYGSVWVVNSGSIAPEAVPELSADPDGLTW